jgi:hypothetical protein
MIAPLWCATIQWLHGDQAIKRELSTDRVLSALALALFFLVGWGLEGSPLQFGKPCYCRVSTGVHGTYGDEGKAVGA